MSTVYATISISLDGHVAGPDDGPGNPLGDGGEQVHEWVVGLRYWRKGHGLAGGTTGPDDEILAASQGRYGAVVMGRRMFDHGEEPWGAEPPFHAPVYVVTHRERELVPRAGGTTFRFVTEGVERAVALAREAAGGKDVQFAGGAAVIQQCLLAGLLDELQVHVAPVFLGGGVRLFDRAELAGMRLEPAAASGSPTVSHLTYLALR